MATIDKMRIICVEDDGSCDFTTLENVEMPVSEIYDFFNKRYPIHKSKNAKWMFIPCS